MASPPDPASAHVLITGACGDLGSRLASHFLGRGHRVLGLDVAPAPPPSLAAHPRLSYAICDLADAAAASRAIEGFIVSHGPVRILINNLGLIFSAPAITFVDGQMQGHSTGEFDRVVAVSLNAAFYATIPCVRHMAAGGGVIVNVSSISANGNPGQAAYSAAKAGINGLTASLAKELGPLGIRVAAIAPGFIDTASTRRAMPPEALAKIKRAVPLRRLGTPEEFVHAVQFVVENSYFTSSVLELDGGLTL